MMARIVAEKLINFGSETPDSTPALQHHNQAMEDLQRVLEAIRLLADGLAAAIEMHKLGIRRERAFLIALNEDYRRIAKRRSIAFRIALHRLLRHDPEKFYDICNKFKLGISYAKSFAREGARIERRFRTAWRNYKIDRMHRAGASVQTLATTFGLTPSRIRQILEQESAKPARRRISAEDFA